jgi:5'-3' exonuclease
LYTTTYYALLGKNESVDLIELQNAIERSFQKKINSINLFSNSKVEDIITAEDSETSWRKSLCEDYKLTRESKSEELKNHQKILVEKISNSRVKLSDYEADDLIAGMCDLLLTDTDFLEIFVISNDKDLLQLTRNNKVFIVSSNNSIETFSHNENRETNSNGFSVKKINPKLELLNKVFLGCSGDNVSKLLKRGVGEKALLKFWDSLDKSREEMEIFKDVGYHFDINPAFLVRNLKLTSLNLNHWYEDTSRNMILYLSNYDYKLSPKNNFFN